MRKCILFMLAMLILSAGKTQSKGFKTEPILKELAQSKPDSSRIGVLIRLSRQYFNEGAIADRLDSATFYLNQARQLNEQYHRIDFQHQIDILFGIHYVVLHPGPDNAKKVFLPLIDSCKKTRDLAAEQEGWKSLAIHTGIDPQDAAYKISCFQNAVALARQLHNKNEEVNLLRHIADVHLQNGKFDMAEGELLQILKDQKNLTPFNEMTTYDLLSVVYLSKGEFDKSLSFSLKALKIMETSGDSSFANTIYTRLSDLYENMNRIPESIEWEKKALNIDAGNNYTQLAYNSLRRIAYLSIREGKPQDALNFLLKEVAKRKPSGVTEKRIIQNALGKCYEALQQYNLAEKCYLEMIRLGNDQSTYIPVDEKAYANFIMGNFYYERENYNKAHEFLETSLKQYEVYGRVPQIASLHSWLFYIDSLLGDYPGAIKHMAQANVLNDSMYTLERNKQVEELQIVYQTEQKDKNFKILEGKQQLTQLALQHSKSLRNWIIAGAFMLLIIAGLLYRQAALRKINNKVIKTKNEQLQHLVTEKEWLLKEVHHRVKNNLHTVIGLLESQAMYLKDEALKANEVSKHRIYAMSLIHQQLYKAENLKTVNMSVFLRELVDYLSESFGTARKIYFNLDIEALHLGVSQAIPVALMVNEAVTNSIKYAFPTGKAGDINISMHQTNDKITLIISDNGIGIAPVILSTELTSLGLKLIKGLSNEIDGQVNFTNENGTRIVIDFNSDPIDEMQALQPA